MQLTTPDLSRRQAQRHSTATAIERESESSDLFQADESTPIAGPFQPLDPSIVHEAIPAFFIGRNEDGFWVARDVKGQVGGIFLFRNSALSFARRHSRPSGCATIFPSGRFELDLENNGNPLVAHFGSLLRVTMRPRQRMIVFAGKITTAVKRRLKNFHIRGN